jgi:peptidoglycan-associated lipoprotein
LSLISVAPVLSAFGTRQVAPETPEALPPVYFAAGATQLQPRDAGILSTHLRWLRGDSRRVVLIEGHTDEPQDSAFSQQVGAERADAVKAYLVSAGIAADRITVVSQGGAQPACREPTTSCRALNRRATFSASILP